jgi:hypothetical protein
MIQINYTLPLLIALEKNYKVLDSSELVFRNEFGKGGVYNFVTKRGCVQDQIPKYHGLKLKRDQLLLGKLFTCRLILKVSFIQ